ncbi:hypothetical protein Pyn_00921 [Prunus yedoensis var. nudiflora]|uniref:Uncharacterized protein n=1 Tax=Prunus yedoensis var. nudiflora TaxID=2094558 RepID=A0A314Z8F7_PRUYE|nr:hypothetical protein Pyn_00921 [Prunus yedoensis var. nudiflora]
MSSSGDSSQEGLNVDLGDGLGGDGFASGTCMLVFSFSFDKPLKLIFHVGNEEKQDRGQGICIIEFRPQ